MAVSFAADILPLFRAKDMQCMAAQGVQLSDYGYMSDAVGNGQYPDHANARHVFDRLSGRETPRMPSGGPYWSQPQLDRFQAWMDGGFQG